MTKKQSYFRAGPDNTVIFTRLVVNGKIVWTEADGGTSDVCGSCNGLDDHFDTCSGNLHELSNWYLLGVTFTRWTWSKLVEDALTFPSDDRGFGDDGEIVWEH